MDSMGSYVIENAGIYLLLSGQILYVIGYAIQTRLPDNFSLDKYDPVEHKFGAFALSALLCGCAGLLQSVGVYGFADGMLISMVLSLPAILLELAGCYLKHASIDERRRKQSAEGTAR